MAHLPIVAISSRDFLEFGCPYCASKEGRTMFANNDQAIWRCDNTECEHVCVVLKNGVTVGYAGEDGHEVKLQPHPLRSGQGNTTAEEVPLSREAFSGAQETPAQAPALPAMEIFVLWHTEDLSQAYVDQFGIPHRAFVVVEQIPVMVVQKRMVPSLADGKQHEALRAVSMQTKEAFTRDWAGFVAGSMAPGFYWDYRQDERGLWRPVDGCMAYNLKLFVPYVTPDGQRAVPMGAEICRMHDQAFLGYQGCIGCRVEAYRAAHAS